MNRGNAAILIPFRSRNTTHQNSAFKETNSADSLLRSIRRACGPLVRFREKMVEFWHDMVFCERGSRNIRIHSILQYLPQNKTSWKKSKVRTNSL